MVLSVVMYSHVDNFDVVKSLLFVCNLIPHFV